MIELNIPGSGIIQLEHLVSDVNGTLAIDGKLIDGVARSIKFLRDRLQIHLITADTHGQQDLIDQQLGLQSIRLQNGNQAQQKADYVNQLNPNKVVAIGQGANDALMLKSARIGICVLSPEGTAVESLLAADLVFPDIHSALEIFDKPLRIVASLRK
jgi:P-type E1-E2 ATPase